MPAKPVSICTRIPFSLTEKLAIYADQGRLEQMIEDMGTMTDVREFFRDHNIDLPDLTT
jgi:hypothetical protein